MTWVNPAAPNGSPSPAYSMPGYDPLTLSPAPAVLAQVPDLQRQFYRPGVNQFRTSPLPPKQNLSANAAIKSIATQVAAQAAGSVPPTLIVPKELTPTQQTGNILKLAWAQEPAGTVFAAPIPLFGGYGDGTDTFVGTSSDPIVSSITSTGASEVALWFQASDGGSLVLPSPWTNWQNNSVASINAQYLPTSGSVASYSGGSGGADYAGVLVLLGSKSLPTVIQSVVNSGTLSGAGSVNTGNFTGANAAGNAIIVFVSVHNVTGTFDTGVTITDTHGNTYTPIESIQNSIGTACIVYFCPVVGAASGNSITATFPAGGPASVTVSALEINAVLQQVNLLPAFIPLTSGFIPEINLSLQNQNGGVTGVLETANGGTGLSAPGANGNVLTSNGTVWTSAPGGGGGGGGIGGVNVQTTNYTLVTGDFGKDVVANSGSAITFNLPATAPTSTWTVFIQNIGAGTLTVNRNGNTIDGAASNLTLTTGQGVVIFSDGTNYFTERGMGSGGGGGVSSLNTLTGALSLTSSDSSLTINPSGSTVDLTITGGGSVGTIGRKVVSTTTYTQISTDAGKILDFQGAGGGTITLAGTGASTITVVQNKDSGAGSSVFSLTFTNPTTTGNTITVGARLTSGSGIPNVTDTQGNTYTHRVTNVNGGDSNMWWDAITIAGGSSCTVQIQTGLYTFSEMIIIEWSGIGGFDTVDATGATGTGTTSTSNAITPGVSDALIIGWTSNSSANGLSITAGSGYTIQATANGNVSAESKLLASPTSTTASFGLSSSVTWFAGILSYAPIVTGSLFSGWVQNNSSGNLIVATTTGLINGAASITLAANTGATIGTDNTNFTAVL